MEEKKEILSEKAEPQKDSAAENESKLSEKNLDEVAGGVFTYQYAIQKKVKATLKK